jgi:probable rRNA maturation factor
MLKIEINNLTKTPLSTRVIRDTIAVGVDWLRENEEGILPNRLALSMAVLSAEEMAKKNLKFRGEAKSTDVLSFVYQQDAAVIEGEILLCLEVIKQNARQDDIGFQTELQKNIVHGLLHILGLKHGEKMFKLQDKLLALFTKQRK